MGSSTFGVKLGKAIKELAPKGVDVYFDNVGGPVLDSVLRTMNNNFRVALCGAISSYNGGEQGLKEYSRLIFKRGTMQGFIFFDYVQHFGKARQQISQWLQQGQLHVQEDILVGIDNAPKGLQKLLQARNLGKVIIQLQPDQLPNL